MDEDYNDDLLGVIGCTIGRKFFDGDMLGLLEVDLDDLFDGDFVGDVLGLPEGDLDGLLEMSLDGKVLGLLEGDLDGLFDGDFKSDVMWLLEGASNFECTLRGVFGCQRDGVL